MESIVSFVARQLGEMIAKEAQLLGGVGEQVKWVQTELTNIRCYLKDADSKQLKGDVSAENWLNQLRNVAYRIEDATDTFYLELEDNHQKDPSFFGKLKKMGHKSMKVPGLHKLATELGDIKKELEEIFKSKGRYEINPLQNEASSGEAVILPLRRAAYEDLEENEVVGLQADKNNILKLLRREETHRRAVITIVGTGGLGKTTLARMVYKEAKSDFGFDIMLPVSQQYRLNDLLKEMICKFKGSEPKKQEMGDLISELRDLLRSKRYLIILDDVWEVEFWEKLRRSLPDVNNGSRVLMTSRSIDVAKSADSGMTPYELAFLNDKESLDLLLKKALRCQEPSEEYPHDLLELANALSKKCKGLPLALIVLGGILSMRDKNYHAWKKVLATMDWHSEGKDCMNVLAMSYEDMPYYLKPCFLYLASFPEDYEISAKRLIRMWVAEGFIPQQEKKTMEEAAELCLNQLFQRSMVQVSSRYPDDSFKSCRVHDLLRDFAMHEAGKENFVTVFPKLESINHSDRVTRRASLQSNCSEFIECVGPNTRSLLWFGQESVSPKYAELRLLRVVEIVGVQTLELKGLDMLIHLKYLGFKNCSYLNIPKDCSLSHMKNLETLDLRKTCIQKGSLSGLWTISTLRHVLCDSPNECPLSPPSNADLRNLQTLRWISDLKSLETSKPPNQFPRLNNLLKLGISLGYRDINWDMASGLLGTLPCLLSLGVRGTNIPKEIVFPAALPNYEDLQTLHLDGAWSKSVAFEASLFPPHLVKLTLINSRLGQDPMLELEKLKSLKKLSLKGEVYRWKHIMTCSSGFPVLESLVIDNEFFSVMKIAEGAMRKLKYLTHSDGLKLEMPPELKKHLTSTFKPYEDAKMTHF